MGVMLSSFSICDNLNAQRISLGMDGGKNVATAMPEDGQVDEKGKMQLKFKRFKKESGIVNGMKVIEYGGINWLFEFAVMNNYEGIQGFPDAYNVANRGELSGEVNLPDVVVINDAFFRNSKIAKVTFGKNLKHIYDGAFQDCSELEEIVFLGDCSNIDMSKDAFPIKVKYNGSVETNVKRFIVPNGTASAFAKKLGLPESMFEDGSATLEYEIKVEKPGTILNQLPIDKLKKIKSLKIVGILDETDMKVIEGCDHLKNLDLTQAYTTLSKKELEKRKAEKEFLQGMFAVMGQVSDAQLKNGEIGVIDNLYVQLVTEMAKEKSQVKNGSESCLIPSYAFSQMSNLESVKLPYRATKIERGAFRGCSSLVNVELPLYLKSIEGDAFQGCTALEKVEFPATTESLGEDVFQGCSSLKKVDLSRCIFKYMRTRFKDCKNLKIIRYPEGLKDVYAIDANKLVDSKWCSPIYYFPKSMTTLRYGAPIFNTDVHFKSETAPKIEGSLNNCTIYVPKGCMTSYYSTFNNNGNIFKEE